MEDLGKYYRVKRRTVECALQLLADGDLERLQIVLESMVNDEVIDRLRAERRTAWDEFNAGRLTHAEYEEISKRISFFLP